MDYNQKILSVSLQQVLALPLLLFAVQTAAQNVTSPYSNLGIGDIDHKDFSRYAASGSAALSRRNEVSYNFSNPASLTSLGEKVVNLEFMMRGRNSLFRMNAGDSLSAPSKDFSIKRVSLSFRPWTKAALAFGLRPYSSVNYQYQLSNAVYNDGTTGYSRTIEGEGGINQAYGSAGYMLGQRFSAGITGSFLFGNTTRKTTYTDALLNLDVTKKEYSYYNGASLQTGFQYYTPAQRKWQHTIGLTATAGTPLRGFSKTEYLNTDTAFLTNNNGTAVFQMPLSAGVGYTLSNREGLSLSVEGDYYHWSGQAINYSNSYTAPSIRLGAGWEYAKREKYLTAGGASYEKYYLAMGFTAQNSYYMLAGSHIWDYSVTLGGGYNMARNLYLHGGLELGLKGSNKAGQIREQYTQYSFGLTIRDIWFRAKQAGN